jgi:hypothetical protein
MVIIYECASLPEAFEVYSEYLPPYLQYVQSECLYLVALSLHEERRMKCKGSI